MHIFVSGNCQVDQIVPLLKAAAPPHVTVSGLRHGPESWPGSPAERDAAQAADVFLTNYDPSYFLSWIDKDRLLQFPDLYFRGFHPDQTALALKNAPHKKLKFSVQVS